MKGLRRVTSSEWHMPVLSVYEDYIPVSYLPCSDRQSGLDSMLHRWSLFGIRVKNF